MSTEDKAEVHLVSDALVQPAKPLPLDGATSIESMPGVVVLRVLAPTTHEWPIPAREGELLLSFHPDLARQIAKDLELAAQEVEPGLRH